MQSPTPFVWDDRLPEEDRETIKKLNAAVQSLEGQRAVEINVAGPFARSKVAWKLAAYQHALLHRIVALLDGTALSFNHRNTLVAVLAARAFMETFAVFAEFETQAKALLIGEDIADWTTLAQNGLFATRDGEFLEAYPGAKAINVLGYIDKFDRKAEGFGVTTIDLANSAIPTRRAMLTYFGTGPRRRSIFRGGLDSARHAHMIIAAIVAVHLVEPMMTRLDDTIVAVADYHHKIAPIRSQ